MALAAPVNLLAESDLSPVELVNEQSDFPILLVCEHAGRAIPAALGDLGVGADILASHRGWDINAEALARAIADELGAPLIIQRYSRLVIDCNRPLHSPQSIPTVSDAADIAGNQDLTSSEVAARVAEIFQPYDAAIERGFVLHKRAAAFSIHSFTPSLGGQDRPWHAGFLSRKNLDTADLMLQVVAQAQPDLTLALNQPYQIDDDGDWFIPAHVEARNLPGCLIEVCNDQIGTDAERSAWAQALARAMRSVLVAG